MLLLAGQQLQSKNGAWSATVTVDALMFIWL
jgi:hypothetical protein